MVFKEMNRILFIFERIDFIMFNGIIFLDSINCFILFCDLIKIKFNNNIL
jgi:hypothetical protein